MRPQQITLAALALVGVWFLLSVATAMFRGGSRDACHVEFRRVFESPTQVNVLYSEIVACPNKDSVARLSIQARNTVQVFLETASVHETPSGITYDPVTFGIAWSGDYSLKIVYPAGLDVSKQVKGQAPWAPGVLKLEVEEIKVEIIPSEA